MIDATKKTFFLDKCLKKSCFCRKKFLKSPHWRPIEDIIILDLKENERTAFIDSCNFLKETAKQIGY